VDVDRAKRHVGNLAELCGLGPGAHVCCVVDTSEQLEAWTERCLAEGASAGQKLYRLVSGAGGIVSGDGNVTIIDPFGVGSSDGDGDGHRDGRGYGYGDSYSYRDGYGDGHGGRGIVDVVLTRFRREAAEARKEGYRGMRLVADMDWMLVKPPAAASAPIAPTSIVPAAPALPSVPAWQQIAAYELMLDALVAEVEATVVCAYRRSSSQSIRLNEILAIHPLVVGQAAGAPGGELGFRMWNIDRGVWEIAGEVDDSNVEPFGRALAAAVASGPVTAIRCHGLTFISASGIRALVELSLAQPGRPLLIQGASPLLRRCWVVLGLDRELPAIAFDPPLPSPSHDGREG
jgi:anti-anti-sigma regulatory factor